MSKIDALLTNPYHSKCFDHSICLYNKSEKSEQPAFLAGDRVIARNDTLGYFYPGKLTKIFECICPLECKCHLLHANIKYDDETKKKNVSSQHMIKISDGSYIIAGDHVMASVLNEYDERCYVPGIVQAVNENSTPKLYTVLYFNGQENYNLRNELIKICKKKYAEITHYIRSKLGIESVLRTENMEKRPESPKPDLNEFKNEIVEGLTVVCNNFSSSLENKYTIMYDEFMKFKNKNKSYNSKLDVNLRKLKKELDDLKYSGPGPIIPRKPKPVPLDDLEDETEKTKLPPQPVELTYEQKIKQLRQELPELKRGDEVLARCVNTGWYYRRLIEEALGNYKYRISFKESQIVYREDIVFIQEGSFQLNDPVLAMHPHHENCYAPGQVIKVSNDLDRYLVRFYDFVESVVHADDCHQFYKIKFQNDINHIISVEKKFIGKYVVARNSNTGSYDIGKIASRASSIVRQQYIVEWSDGTESLENFIVFGPNSQNIVLNVKDCILALKDELYYYPAKIISRHGSQIVIEFFNGEIYENINLNECFMITREHYRQALRLLRQEDTTLEATELLPEEARPAELLAKPKVSVDATSLKQSAKVKYEKRETPVIDARQFYTHKNGKIKSVRYQS